MKKIKINNYGSIYLTDILLSIVIIIIITSSIFTISSLTINKIDSNIEDNKIKTLSNQLLDTLTETEGSPDNWEELPYNKNFICGLKSSNNSQIHLLSYNKILKLKENYNIITKNMFNNEIKSQIEIKPLNPNLETIEIGDNPISSSNIYLNKRFILIDYYSKYQVKNISKNDICNKNHGSNFICTEFNLNKSLSNYNYYLIVDNDIDYYLDNGINTAPNRKTNNRYSLLNDDLIKLSNTTIIIHIKKDNDFNGLIIEVPKDFNKNYLKYEYFTFEKAEIILKTWYN